MPSTVSLEEVEWTAAQHAKRALAMMTHLLDCSCIASYQQLLNTRHNVLPIRQLLELVQVCCDASHQQLSL